MRLQTGTLTTWGSDDPPCDRSRTYVSYPTSGPFRVLNARPLVYLGILSYAFYLVHGIVLQMMMG
jgi:hypothetical protein